MNASTMVKLAARNALRRPARSGLTASMVVVSVALLVIALSYVQGIFGQMLRDTVALIGHARVVAPEYAQKEEMLPLYANLPTSLGDSLSKLPGVTGVEPRITTGATVTIGAEIGDVFAQVIGARESYLRERLGARDKLVAGAWFTGGPDELVVGNYVVEQLGAKVGDELVLLGATQDGSLSPLKGRLVGIVHGAGVDQAVLLPLERAQALTDIPDGATELLVYGTDLESAGALAKSLREAPGVQGALVQAWNERQPWGSMTALVGAMEVVMILILGLLTALGIWNTMTMSVLERTSELGVLRAMGMERWRVVGLVLFEAVTIAVVGGAVGVALGAGPAWWLSVHGIFLGDCTTANVGFAMSATLYGNFSVAVLWKCWLLGLGMAVAGTLVPALRAASIPPIAAMRTGR